VKKFRKKMEEALAEKYGDKVRVELIDESDTLAGFGLEIASSVDKEEVQDFVNQIAQSMNERSPEEKTEIGLYLKKLEEAEEELESYSKLKEGWDGVASYPIHPVALDWALQTLEACRGNAHMQIEVETCPHPDGNVSLNLMVGGRELDITVSYTEASVAYPEEDEVEDEAQEDEEDWALEPGLSLMATTFQDEIVVEDETPIVDNFELQNKWIRWLVSEKRCGCGDAENDDS